MRVIAPITITDAMLVGSNVPETPPAIYAAGTTYALDGTCSTGTVGGVITVWRSLQDLNNNNTPASSPAWWESIGETYAVYSNTATYAKGNRVIDPTAHLVYESQLDANSGQSLTLGTAWLKIGPTNRWAAFDNLRNTQAVAPVDIVYQIQLSDRASSISVIGLDARHVTIEMAVAGVQKYTVTADLKKRKSKGWKDYFFNKFGFRTSVQYFDLPPYRNALLTVRVSKAKGQRGVGGILIGNSVYIGDVQYEPTSDHLNFSGVDRDEFGNITLIPRRSVPKVNLTIWFNKTLTSQILALREETNGRPAVWSGLDDFTLDYFEPLFIYGIPKEFSLNLKEFDFGIITLQLEEM